MISREEALTLVTSLTENKNLIKHMLSVEAAMGGLSKYFGEDEKYWKIVGLLHDADYEKYPEIHPMFLVEELEKRFSENMSWYERGIIDAIKAHAWGYRENLPEPKSKLEWSLYCCDELTGFIIAVTLIRPEKRLSSVTVENILSKWNKLDFAKGVNRDQIGLCEEKLGIKLIDFIGIVLKSMQNISNDLGL